MLDAIVRGQLLIPNASGVRYEPDGALAWDAGGILQFAGPWAELEKQLSTDRPSVRTASGVMLPPLLDIHTHISQHPVRGRFTEGVDPHDPEGWLLAGLRRNMFPAERRCHDPAMARQVVDAFLADTLSHGVIGGAAYMTVSAAATEIALQTLPDSWSVGMVLMNQNCPEYLRTDEPNLAADVTRLATKFGSRFILTDRFAVSTAAPLRTAGVALANRFGLRTQTHLNEQIAEKTFVEKTLYPDAGTYTNVYLRDGLLNHRCILAHCIHMSPDEWRTLADTGSVVAHCPTSNLLLKSGVMPLDEVIRYKIPYALGTDVGASPTTSMLAEMRRFLIVHDGHSIHATPCAALQAATVSPANILGLDASFGTLRRGRPASFIEVTPATLTPAQFADDAILSILPVDLDRPAPVARVTIAGKTIFHGISGHA